MASGSSPLATSGSQHPLSQVNTAEELFILLESNRAGVVREIKQTIGDLFKEVRDAWLVNGLYDFYSLSSESPRILELLLGVPEPHEKFLCDRINDGIKQGGKTRLTALTLLGYVVRKQPPWLYKVTQHALSREMLKVLKTEDDLVILMCALLDLVALMPVLPAYIAPYLNDLFEIFSRLASWRYQHIQSLPAIQQVHVQVGLYAFFHRLYGMFPCNFLSYLRTQYSENNKDNRAVFIHTIRPMLNTVRMHPLLVTHSRDQEKTHARWKKMELHDVIVESSRYSLINQESNKEDREPPSLDVGAYNSTVTQAEVTPDIHDLCSAMSHDPLWTPGRRIDISTPPPATHHHHPQSGHSHPGAAGQTNSGEVVGVTTEPAGGSGHSRLVLDSPPEAAIEATPESTPFVTPVKDETFRFSRPTLPSAGTARQLNLSAPSGHRAVGPLRSPLSLIGAGGTTTPGKEMGQFKFPDAAGVQQQPLGRRDSIFERPMEPSHLASKLSKVGSERGVAGEKVDEKDGQKPQTEAPVRSERDTPLKSPSPVRFTSQRPDQFPIKPEPERPPPNQVPPDAIKSKIISLENLREALVPDYAKDDDDEVSKITGGGEDPSKHQMDSRHITPQICVDSGATSRTVSSFSTSSQPTTPAPPRTTTSCSSSSRETPLPSTSQQRPMTSAAASSGISQQQQSSSAVPSSSSSSECRAGGLHLPSRDSVDDFVRQVKGRIRFFSVCGPSADIAAEVSAALSCDDSEPGGLSVRECQRSSSCPDEHQLRESLRKKMNSMKTQELLMKSDLKAKVSPPSPRIVADNGSTRTFFINAEVQTDEFVIFPYEHLFPSAMPQWFMPAARQEEPAGSDRKNDDESEINPYVLLDQYVQAAIGKARGEPADKDSSDDVKILRSEITLLHNLMLFERHRREVLGIRNRRLLGKTKSSRILEEQNNALRDQLQIVASEIKSLLDQLDTVRKEKHVVEEARAKGAKDRDMRIEELVSENRQLKENLGELKVTVSKREEELKEDRLEMQKLEAALFKKHAELLRLEEKEESRELAESELFRLRRELMLMGELQIKYRERLEAVPIAAESKQDQLFVQAYEGQLADLQAELLSKGHELEACRARIQELEQTVLKKDLSLAEQKKMIKRATDENLENLTAVETANESLKAIIAQQGAEIMRLQHSLSLASRPVRVGGVGGGRTTSNAPAVTASAGMDIRSNRGVNRGGGAGAGGMVLPVGSVVRGMDDKPFVVGSPPLSSGSSENSEALRRIVRGDPMDLERLVDTEDEGGRSAANRSSPEIGSAVSAREAFEANDSSSGSINGTNH